MTKTYLNSKQKGNPNRFMIVRFPGVFDVDMTLGILIPHRVSSLYILMLSGQSKNPIIEEKMRLTTTERMNRAISKVNMGDGARFGKLSIKARFALNRVKRVFQSKEVPL